MKKQKINILCLLLAWLAGPAVNAQTYLTPKMGGGNMANAPMIHIDIFYDAVNNLMQANLDTSYGAPQLNALPNGYAFDPAANYAVLSGKAYNYQYGWNLGGLFTPPLGAGIWIEQNESSPGLECYDGRSDKGTYEPIFGTDDSSPRWCWSGVMTHNTYAVSFSYSHELSATYSIFFGEATTGSRQGYENYPAASVTLTWTTIPALDPNALQIGSLETNGVKRLYFVNAGRFNADTGAVLELDFSSSGPYAHYYSAPLTFTVLPATAALGGPVANSPLVGSYEQVEVVSVNGPPGGAIGLFEPGSAQPLFLAPTGPSTNTCVFPASESDGAPDADAFGQIEARRFVATKPGLYTVDFRAIDTSTNAPGGKSFHQPSETLRVSFQAGLLITSLTRKNETTTVSFRGRQNTTLYLEAAEGLDKTNAWAMVDGPMAGRNEIMTLTDPSAARVQRIYRLRAETP